MNYEKNDRSGTSGANVNCDPIVAGPKVRPIGAGCGPAVDGPVADTAVGPIVAGHAGKAVAGSMDPTSEVDYWRDNFRARPYAENATSFDDYGPAYLYGVNSYTKYPGRSFDEVESDLSRDWDGARGSSKLPWDQARCATRDAWDRIVNR